MFGAHPNNPTSISRVNVKNRLSYFDNQIPGVNPGTLLVASPALYETPFRKAVVLVVQNNHDGTFGVVLNRPATDAIKYAWHELTGSHKGDRNIVQGGPIGGPVFAIHQQRAIAELQMPSGICVTTQSDKFPQIINQTESNYRIVFGVAGWNNDQLFQEISDGLWYQLDGNPEQVFDESDFMWEKSLRRYGRHVLADVIGLNKLPIDPLLN